MIATRLKRHDLFGTASRGLDWFDWAPQRPAALRAISNVASPIRNVPARNPISRLELPTGITEASIRDGPINLKKIRRTIVSVDDNVCIKLLMPGRRLLPVDLEPGQRLDVPALLPLGWRRWIDATRFAACAMNCNVLEGTKVVLWLPLRLFGCT